MLFPSSRQMMEMMNHNNSQYQIIFVDENGDMIFPDGNGNFIFPNGTSAQLSGSPQFSLNGGGNPHRNKFGLEFGLEAATADFFNLLQQDE